jgi:c-di-GMP-binding flagellar brake protein YcgR
MKSTKTKVKTEKSNSLNLWDRLEIKLQESDQSATFITRVENITGDIFEVECPVRIAGQLSLRVGQTLEISYEKGEEAFAFRAGVVSIDARKENTTTLKQLSKAESTQRRKFVRIDIQGQVNFRVLDLKSDDFDQMNKMESGALLNISAGGILLCSTAKISQGDYLLLNFRLKNQEKLENILGVVKRAEAQSKDSLIGVEFLTKDRLGLPEHIHVAGFLPSFASYFDDELERHLVQYVYNQEVAARKKKMDREEK